MNNTDTRTTYSSNLRSMTMILGVILVGAVILRIPMMLWSSIGIGVANLIIMIILTIASALILSPFITYASIPKGSVGVPWLFGWVLPTGTLSEGLAWSLGKIIILPSSEVIVEYLLRTGNDEGVDVEFAVPKEGTDGPGIFVKGKLKASIRFSIINPEKLIPQLGLEYRDEEIDWRNKHLEVTANLIKAKVLELIRGAMAITPYNDAITRGFKPDGSRNGDLLSNTTILDAITEQFGLKIVGIVPTRVDLDDEFMAVLRQAAEEKPERGQEKNDLKTTLELINEAMAGNTDGSGKMDPATATMIALLSKKDAHPTTLLAIAGMEIAKSICTAVSGRK